MSDFDSNPFADPDLNNPFKVSVVPSIPRRRDASLFMKTDKFLCAHCACPLASLGSLAGGSVPQHPFCRSRSRPRVTRLGVGAEPLRLCVRPPLPTSPTDEGLTRERARAPGGSLARFSGTGRVRVLGRWSCHLPGKCSRPGRDREVVMGARPREGLSWGPEAAGKGRKG